MDSKAQGGEWILGFYIFDPTLFPLNQLNLATIPVLTFNCGRK